MRGRLQTDINTMMAGSAPHQRVGWLEVMVGGLLAAAIMLAALPVAAGSASSGISCVMAVVLNRANTGPDLLTPVAPTLPNLRQMPASPPDAPADIPYSVDLPRKVGDGVAAVVKPLG